MSTEENKVRIRSFLGSVLRNHDLQDNEDVFALGLVNSLFAMQLVQFVEHEFGMTVEDEDLDVDNFNTVNAISQLVERKSVLQLL
jgi:methoxymalonate biosynthesis acyl carrier protein